MEKKIKVGEIVWAKVKGFPWWPGIIVKPEESLSTNQEAKFLVNFIGHPSHASIPKSRVEKFERKYEDFSKTKKKSLLNSIYLANKISKGELSFNNHMKYKIPDNQLKKESSKSNSINQADSDSSSESLEENKRKPFLAHKRLKKFINENNHHLDKHQYSKRTKSSNHMNEENNNLIRQATNITKADSVDTIIAETDRRKDIIAEKLQETLRENINDELEMKIKQLLLSKIELPSSSLNKSMISSLEQIYNLIEKINTDDLYELVKDLLPFLNGLIINKNESLSSRALALSNLLRKKILDNIFTYTEGSLNTYDFEGIVLKQLSSELSILLNQQERKDCDENRNKSTNKALNSKISKNPGRPAFIPKISNFPKTYQNSNAIKDYINLKNNLDFNPKRDDEQAENNSVSEISLDSHKTDCEEAKVSRLKISIKPLDHISISEILFEYFMDFKICKLDHDDLIEILVKKEFFDYANRDKEKTMNPIKYHYMRKRVCYKLYKVFGKLLKLMKLDKDTIKNLSIYLELKAREKDPGMGDQYKNFICTIFHKIKEKLMITNINTSLSMKIN